MSNLRLSHWSEPFLMRQALVLFLVGLINQDYVRPNMTNSIYKVCSRAEWQAAQQLGSYNGSVDDRRDGFIHFSTADQLATTLAKHFAGQGDLFLITVEASILGNELKWEQSRGGELFPHLYGRLSVSDTKQIQDLPLGSDGHIIPELETL